MSDMTYSELMSDQAAALAEPAHYFQIRFKRLAQEGWNEELRATTVNTAVFVTNQLLRTKDITSAYVVERKADGTWVRNW